LCFINNFDIYIGKYRKIFIGENPIVFLIFFRSPMT